LKGSIRYYMGRHEVKILLLANKKVLIEHQEKGFVGNKEIGYKSVNRGDLDISLIRFCYKNKKEVKKQLQKESLSAMGRDAESEQIEGEAGVKHQGRKERGNLIE